MDNLTHTLIGVALGDTLARQNNRVAGGASNVRRKAAIWTAVLGSNLPDLDSLAPLWQGKGNLDYLLVHRGFTHSVLLAPPIALLATWLGAILGREKGFPGWKLYALGLISVLLHLGADYCNSYGVHPLSPLLNQWFYGDFIFIIEPLILFVLLPYAFFAFHSKFSKMAILAAGVVLSGLVVSQIFIPWLVSLAVLVWAGAFIFLQKRYRNAVPLSCGLLTVMMVFWVGSRMVKSDVTFIVHGEADSIEVSQLVTTPAPGNPLCWSVVMLGVENSQNYVARTGFFSLSPTLFPPGNCYTKVQSFSSSLLAPVTVPSRNPALVWKGEFRKPLSEFKDLRQRNCLFHTFLKFARVPIWYKTAIGLMAEDLRYSREGRSGFSKVEVDLDQECPKVVPPWQPPTSEIQ